MTTMVLPACRTVLAPGETYQLEYLARRPGGRSLDAVVSVTTHHPRTRTYIPCRRSNGAWRALGGGTPHLDEAVRQAAALTRYTVPTARLVTLLETVEWGEGR